MIQSTFHSDTNSKTTIALLSLQVLTLFGLMIALAGGCASNSEAVNKNPAAEYTEYESPDDAVQAMIAALRADDIQQLHSIFGSEGDKIIFSGDAVADKQGIDKFLQSYDQKHELTKNDDGSMTLVVGNNDWPSPIPVVQDRKTHKWYLDAEAGEDEILNRRIGRNELDVIQVCQAIADAQQEYAERDPEKAGVPEYAQKFLSDPGKKNGLYWPTAEGEQPSPLGSLVADAVAEGYSTTKDSTGPKPYQGYFFHMLKSQGANAPGGAQDYIVNGQMLGGFAALAYPAQYGNSGIMTFMVDSHGNVYQKDLGPDTGKLAPAITSFDPTSDWQKLTPSQLAPQ